VITAVAFFSPLLSWIYSCTIFFGPLCSHFFTLKLANSVDGLNSHRVRIVWITGVEIQASHGDRMILNPQFLTLHRMTKIRAHILFFVMKALLKMIWLTHKGGNLPSALGICSFVSFRKRCRRVFLVKGNGFRGHGRAARHAGGLIWVAMAHTLARFGIASSDHAVVFVKFTHERWYTLNFFIMHLSI